MRWVVVLGLGWALLGCSPPPPPTPDAGVDAGRDAGPPPTTCLSGTFWTPADGDTEQMAPGQACRACHLLNAPDRAYYFMGTVFSARHEEDDCVSPPPQGAVVEILDLSGAVTLTLQPNASGNFLSTSVAAGVPVPYRARVRSGGKVREMMTPRNDGDCNGCHTEQGEQGAPGRIVWP